MASVNRTAKIKAVAQWLREQDDIAILTHISPDGDALGSTLALMHALHAMGKRAFVCNQHTVPDFLRLLPGCEEVVTPDALPFPPRAILSVDSAEPKRLGTAAELITENLPIAMIDHHETNTADFETAFVDGEASAAGSMVYEVLSELGAEITKDIATCLYVAISTDTGNFSFSCTTPEALVTVSECLKAGLDIADLSFRLFRMKSAARTRLLGRVLNGIEYLADGKLALLRVTFRDLEACGASSADTDGIVNFGIDTEGAEVAILATEKADGTKFSLRSRGSLNVAQAVKALGGGGHAQAAGVTLPQQMNEAVPMVLSAVLPLL